jgi:preprotein translocase subunit SecB
MHTKIVSGAVFTAFLGRSAKKIPPVFPYKREMVSTLLGKSSFAKVSVRAKGCPFTQIDHRMLRPGQL